MEKVAYSYVRISSAVQAHGDGIRRQTAETERICREKGWTLSNRKFRDIGISAFDSSNLSENRGLGRLIKLIEIGEIERGSIIVIEALDRLTRATPLDALSLLTRIVSMGVEIFTTVDNQHFSKERLNQDPACLFITLGQLIRGRDESEKKSNRSRAWIKQQKQKNECFTGRNPFWIAGRPHQGETYTINESRAKIVREAYRLAKLGYGANKIAQTFNQHGSGFHRDDGKIWAQSSIQRFLADEAVFGVLMTKEDEWIENYYPPIITEDEFREVRMIVEMRTRKQNRNPKLTTSNLFTSIVSCRCGAGLFFAGAIDENGYDARMLKCMNTRDHGGCESIVVPYGDFENEILYLLYVHLNQRFGKKSNPGKLLSLNAKIDAIDAKIKNFTDAIENADSPTVINMMVKKIEAQERDKKQIQEQIMDLKGSEVALKHVVDRRELFDNWKESIKSDEARRELIQSIRLIVAKIIVDRIPHRIDGLTQYRQIDIISENNEFPIFGREIKMKIGNKARFKARQLGSE